MPLTPLAQRTLTAHVLGVPSGHNFQPRAPRGSLIPGWVSAALLQPMAKCSGDAGETVRSQMLQKPSVGGRGCVGTASQLSFATCPMLLSHCAVTKVDTSYINPPQHLLSQRFVTSGTGSGDDERDSHFSSAGWQPGCPPPRPGAAPEATPRAGPGAVVCDGAESGHNLELGLPQL